MRLLVTGRNTGPDGIGGVAGERQVFLDQSLREHMDGYKADFAALALDPKMQHPLTALHVLNAQAAEFLTADAVIEQGGEDGAIADALERIVGRRVEQLAGLGITQCWRAAFVVVGHWPLDAVDRIAGDGVVLAEIIEQGRERRELAADAGRGELAGLEVLAPGDHVSAGDGPQLRRAGAAR